jgi:hypothetical protein
MIRHCAAAAGIATKLGNHGVRTTGTAASLKNEERRKRATEMATHALTRTTRLYDYQREKLCLDVV